MLTYFLNNYIPPLSMIKTAGDRSGIYKGFEWHIDEDREEDNVKLFHYVKKPNGELVHVDLSPYDRSVQPLLKWIDKNLVIPAQKEKKVFEDTFGKDETI